jgi:hypothetical protein
MAFCTGCGAQIDETTKFCPACGTRVPDAVAPGSQPSATGAAYAGTGAAATTAASSTPAAPVAQSPRAGTVQPVAAPSGGGSAVKVIIIVLVIIVGLALLAFAGVFWAGYKLKKAIRVEQSGENATVSTPWGKVSSNQDSTKVAKEMGFEIYPGAKPLPGASAVSFGGSTVGSAEFESDDPIDKVGKFYSSRYPKSTINSADEGNQTIMASTDKGMMTIVLEKQGSGTKISLSRIGGNGAPRGSNQTE